MHRFLELITVAFFLLTAWHAWKMHGRRGLWLFACLLFLGALRENFVILREYLYGFAPLSLMLGKAPVIAAVIWGYSIYAALTFATAVSGSSWRHGGGKPRFLACSALFMMALACFYEPFLALVQMARWQDGTWAPGGLPVIALVGYPSLAVLALLIFHLAWARFPRSLPRAAALGGSYAALALLHAWGLQSLKSLLGW